jgi:ABC-type branched-subunit amino acid transport system permease subunit
MRAFFIFSTVIVVLVMLALGYFKKTFFHKVLSWRWEQALSIKSLGTKVQRYKTGMILITTALAVIGGNMFGFYYLYIDPPSFWIGMLEVAIVTVFISYKRNDRGTYLVSIWVTLVYEYMRFFKVVDANNIGYFREILFGVLIIIVSFSIFRKTAFGRDV